MRGGADRLSAGPRISADGHFYWDGSRWVPVAAASPPGPLPSQVQASPALRSPRVPTSWTKPMQWTVAGLAALAGLWYLAMPFWLAAPLTGYVQHTTQSQADLSPPGYGTSIFTPVITGALAATSLVAVIFAAVIVAGALRRWSWMHYAVMVVLGFSILGLPPAVANALGFSGLSPLNEPLRAAQLVSAAMGVVAIPLLAWMMVAALRRGPWATRRLAGQ